VREGPASSDARAAAASMNMRSSRSIARAEVKRRRSNPRDFVRTFREAFGRDE